MLPPTPLMHGLTIRDRHKGDGGVTKAEVSRWCKQKKRNEMKKKKTKVIGPLTTPTKDPQVRSYHGIAENGGGEMKRDIAVSPELAKEKKNINALKENHLNNQTK